ncbi:MAG TPA: hypothetical protein VGN95_19025 [Pyrinomonadaceae bacterium]|nr:hypothetical protein [Pyrinomonadaceae bacterium]
MKKQKVMEEDSSGELPELQEAIKKEASGDGVVVEFPQAEKSAPVDDAESARQAQHVTEEKEILNELAEARWSDVNRLSVDYDSIAVGELERGPLLRIFREQWRNQIKYQMSERGGGLSLENACLVVDAEYGPKPTPDERLQELLNTSMENVSFDQLMRMYIADSEKAERYFGMVKNEAQREFATGHLAAKAFEPARWMSTVWHRAQFLAVRDSFISEYLPDGGIEFSLVDMLVQCYFMQQYWMEQTVERTQTDPRRESYEFAKWQEYKKHQVKAYQWDNPTHWEIPYASQLECIENAARMVALFSTLYQKTLRQLNSHRMMKFRLHKIKAETRRINALTRQTIKGTKGGDQEG